MKHARKQNFITKDEAVAIASRQLGLNDKQDRFKLGNVVLDEFDNSGRKRSVWTVVFFDVIAEKEGISPSEYFVEVQAKSGKAKIVRNP